jgi:hypothetical protein
MGDPDSMDGCRVQSDLVPDRMLDFAAPRQQERLQPVAKAF